jgi:recombination DNA repair RAD52 pathway protein
MRHREGRGSHLGEAHDLALKAAETDATKRALVTFGKAFGLALYSDRRRPMSNPRLMSR